MLPGKHRVISEKPWIYVLLEGNDTWVLTVMIRYGPAENDISIKLLEAEVSRLKSEPGYIDQLVDEISQNPQNYTYREIRPAVWPR